ncbi:hypothetical protein [Hymenobacter metallicola]|uniref:Uncharacterized protein n=1 Tax=Hymenobacter metallicola TaxID=2563114 RepID=A0A4Z0QC13_9BACT|nr:hypothetical protein [Hymenobacter metallicola]TGE26703.1 hypothetical protein E5K02_18170 [Hymenobacter metallicola]
MLPARFYLYASLLLLTQCSKCKQGDPFPKNQLPWATQTGANTFGCLVNGQLYLPQGNVGSRNFNVSYDPTFRGGAVVIETYRVENNRTKFLSIDAAPITAIGSYSLDLQQGVGEVLYTDTDGQLSPCSAMYDSRDVSYRKGRMNITRFDQQARIISGTFDVTIGRTGCDTLKVTQGRFDARF